MRKVQTFNRLGKVERFQVGNAGESPRSDGIHAIGNGKKLYWSKRLVVDFGQMMSFFLPFV